MGGKLMGKVSRGWDLGIRWRSVGAVYWCMNKIYWSSLIQEGDQLELVIGCLGKKLWQLKELLAPL